VAEFAPYVFQILSQLVEVRLPPLPPNYMALFSPLLTPLLWERSANVPALVRLLQAYLQKAPHEIISQQKLPAVLGVFQKLIASKHTDHQGFFILNTVVENLPVEVRGGNRVAVLKAVQTD
jgi:exportin-2 (importin alpha re-exporter)